jgi:predicted ArsR family transcriptional regulator
VFLLSLIFRRPDWVASMTAKNNTRQHQILKLLLENKRGLSIDEFAAALSISRTAVQQHLSNLERDGYIQAGVFNKTAGRPVRTFVLTGTRYCRSHRRNGFGCF